MWPREALPLSPEVQKAPPCSLNSFSERSLGAAGSSLSPRLGQQFKSKGLYIATYQSQRLPVRAPKGL